MQYTSNLARKGLIIALTGGIASGKSFTLACFKRLGFYTYSLDQEIAQLYKVGQPLYNKIREAFPEAVDDTKVLNHKLSDIVFNDAKQLQRLEQIVHPVIREYTLAFINECKQYSYNRSIVVEIPLFFETGNYKGFDMVISTIATAKMQENRAKARKNMTKQKFTAIMIRQVSDEHRINNSDVIICTKYNKSHTFKQIKWITSGRSIARNSFRYRNNRLKSI